MTKWGTCALCQKGGNLELSHIIPKFVFRYLKKNSFSGILRNATNPNVALQDGDKKYLLCSSCEDLFQKNETKFSNQVFIPFKKDGVVSFEYEDNWLLHFITSVNWRILTEDIPSYEAMKDPTKPLVIKQLELFGKTEETMRQFLLGNRLDLDSIQTHIFFYQNIEKMSRNLFDSKPHSMIHGGIQGYSFTSSEGMYIFANLLGVFIVTIIKPVKYEKWKNTFVKNEPGKIKTPQNVVASPIFNKLEYLNEQRQNGINNISEKQRQSIISKIEKDPERFKASESYKRIIDDRKIQPLE